MQTGTARAISTLTNTPTPIVSQTATAGLETPHDCSANGMPIAPIFWATETALPSQPLLTPGQIAQPQPTLAPIPVQQLRMPGCPSPTPNLTATQIPTCFTSVNGLSPTPSPTAKMASGVEIDCLPSGQNIYVQICPATVPLPSSLSFHIVIGPPFKDCDELTHPIPTMTRTSTLVVSPTPTVNPSRP